MAGEWLDSSDLAASIRSLEHACQIWQGVAAEDPVAVLSHCETLLAWPNPPDRPVSAIAHGGVFLLDHLPTPQLRDFVTRFAEYVVLWFN
jgi:hypothetical protein